MYAFLKRHLPEPIATTLAVIWYALLITAIAILLNVLPQAPFRYEML